MLVKTIEMTSKCCNRLHGREWIFSGKTNLDFSLAYHDFQWSLNCQYLAIIRKFDGLDMAYRWYTEKTNVLCVFLFRRVWVRGLGKVCLWLFLLRSIAKNTVTLTNVCVTGFMVHRDQLQRCILCSKHILVAQNKAMHTMYCLASTYSNMNSTEILCHWNLKADNWNTFFMSRISLLYTLAFTKSMVIIFIP